MVISFQAATQEDIPLLLQFMQEYYEFDQHPYQAAPAQTALERLICDPNLGRVWLICADSEAVGYGVLTLGYSLEYLGRDAFVDELYIREAYRRQGIGQQTFQFLEEVCRTLGVQALHLEVEHHNTSAQAFYRKIGFYDQERYLMTRQISQG